MNLSIGRASALLATARIANVPSVLGNVGLGLFLGGGQLSGAPLLISGVCLYFCGGFLNDWADREWDRECRPERALPSGRFSSRAYLSCGVVFAACALGIAALVSKPAFLAASAIILCVVAYTWLHKKTAWSAIFMGACRALLPLLGWAATAEPSRLPAAALAGFALFFHVLGISLMARRESLPGAKRPNFALISFAMAAGCMLLCTQWQFHVPLQLVVIGALPYVMCTLHSLGLKTGISGQVAGLLAGIPLVDWMLLLPIFLMIVLGGSGNPLLGLSFWLWMPPIAFLAGKLLQRYSPAT